MDDEQRLPGGRTAGAVRYGDAVYRPLQPWTPAVHALLRHLEAVGLEGAPRVRGVDDRGREVLTYLDGETAGEELPWPPWVYSETALHDVGQWARKLHDATQSFVPPPDARWHAGQTWRPGLIIGHHDAAPWNAVWREGHLAGFFDWDTAGPSTREFDLAFMALTWVPLHTRRFAERTGFTAFEDRSRRLHLLLDAYEYAGDRSAFATVVAARARTNAEVIRRMAAGGDPVYTALEPIAAELDQAAREVGALPACFWRPPV
ncbi:phosphotransferase [Streptomyces spectabilis]|uniref:Aminoglycoside phosphotransferase family protein n=1 Tax=Streptomyces spectabilis TaxID=68270 RepID=A0A516R1N8_STRST|nr:phosphotransferase [Streptomyces spectabilis]QDQ09561.1 aminoglycoside phosphotransferase family protein [Streptomyces spectabilis]